MEQQPGNIGEAIKALQAKINEYASEHGSHDHETDGFEFNNECAESYCEGLDDAMTVLKKYA